jgi:hypothetical protein
VKYHTTILVPILALVATALLAACGQAAVTTSGTNSNASDTNVPVAPVSTAAPTQIPAPTPTLAPTPAPTSSNPLEVFAKAQTALLGAKTIRLTINITKSGKTSTDVMEAMTATAYHMVPSSGDEVIIIKGQGMYTKKNGKWTKSPVAASLLDSIIANVNPISYVGNLKQRMDAKVTPQIGADLLDGKPMVTYTYSAQGGSAKFWYGVTDGWLYKFETDDANGTKTVATIEYNIPITITAPI